MLASDQSSDDGGTGIVPVAVQIRSSNSSRDPSTRSASSKPSSPTPPAGTATQTMPASFAARTPWIASSTARQRSASRRGGAPRTGTRRDPASRGPRPRRSAPPRTGPSGRPSTGPLGSSASATRKRGPSGVRALRCGRPLVRLPRAVCPAARIVSATRSTIVSTTRSRLGSSHGWRRCQRATTSAIRTPIVGSRSSSVRSMPTPGEHVALDGPPDRLGIDEHAVHVEHDGLDRSRLRHHAGDATDAARIITHCP